MNDGKMKHQTLVLYTKNKANVYFELSFDRFPFALSTLSKQEKIRTAIIFQSDLDELEW